MVRKVLLLFSHRWGLRPSYLVMLVNSLPNDKFLNRSKLKAFADDKINVTEILKFVLGRVENNAGKGENAGYQHFLLFPQCFQKASFSGSLKSGSCCKRLNKIDIKDQYLCNIFLGIIYRDWLIDRLINWSIDWLIGVLRHFQHYFSHIMATSSNNNLFPGFTCTGLESRGHEPKILPVSLAAPLSQRCTNL